MRGKVPNQQILPPARHINNMRVWGHLWTIVAMGRPNGKGPTINVLSQGDFAVIHVNPKPYKQ